jgi:hypothetical protein
MDRRDRPGGAVDVEGIEVEQDRGTGVPRAVAAIGTDGSRRL